MIDPASLRDIIRNSLLSFPVTPFDAENNFNSSAYSEHLEWLSQHNIAGLIVAGGTGELFSLTPKEVIEVVVAARLAQPGKPLIAGCGYGTKMAIEMALEIEASGADGILLLPHYLVDAPQDGIAAHIRAVCEATRMSVIVYNRGQCVVNAATLAQIAEECPNLIGFKDGTGDIDTVKRITVELGDRLAYIGGMPTHELFAQAFRGAGVNSYSSAVFNFVPEVALAFHSAFVAVNNAVCEQLLREFYYPFARIRDRKEGYAVAAIKAGVSLRGFETGPVRPPLTDLTEAEKDQLGELIHKAGSISIAEG